MGIEYCNGNVYAIINYVHSQGGKGRQRFLKEKKNEKCVIVVIIRSYVNQLQLEAGQAIVEKISLHKYCFK